MSIKYTVVVVAYKDVESEIENQIKKFSIREIDEPSDLVNFCNYGRQFDQDSRVCIYLDWYKDNILKYLKSEYNIVVLEIPYALNQPIVEALNKIDIELGDHVLVIEHDEI